MNLKRIKSDFPYHTNKEDDFYLFQISKSYQYCGVHNFDFSNTNISYEALFEMWASPGIGFYVNHFRPKYYDRKLVSTVYIEIQNSRLHREYDTFTEIKDLFKLPYRDPFLINL